MRAVLGVGGFAVVVRAYDEGLDTDVAIKVLEQKHMLDADVRRRFVSEAQLLRRVRSPHVVAVHDIGELEDGRPFFVMEFADRGVLADRVSAGAVHVEGLAAVIRSLAAGLGSLHAADLVHRDVKPANLLVVATAPDRGGAEHSVTSTGRTLLDEDERLVVGDLGLAKDQARTGADPTILGGTPLFRAPEQSRLGTQVTASADVYAASGVVWNILTGEPPPLPAELGPRMAGIPAAWFELFERGMAVDPAERLGTMAEWEAVALAAVNDASPGAAGIGFRTAAPGTTCPYKGLASFQPEDAALFFGREALVDELVGRLQSGRTLVIGGPSGSGKSSLLRAGLIPAIEAGALPGSQHWATLLLTPGPDPMAELHHQLTTLAPQDQVPSASQLASDPRSVRSLVAIHPGALVAIDQFEELFTLNPPAEAEAFIAVLAQLVDQTQSRIRIAIALRADFYSACAEHQWLARCISDNQVLVGPMQRAELRRAIEGPARRVGLRLEDGLVDAVLDERGAEPGSLPLVAHALIETWLRRRGSLLTVDGFRTAGGVAGAISQRADDLYEHKLDDPERLAAQRLLLRLVNPGEGALDTRRRIGWTALGDDESTRRVVGKLADARLLTVDDQTIEIAHEAIIQTWPRLRGWIDRAGDDLRTRQRIGRAASEWDSQRRNPALLYRGTPLAAALEWASAHPDELSALDAQFLETSEAARRAEEEAAATEMQRRRRIRRLALIALACLAAAAVAASIVALAALQQSRGDERKAREASVVANDRFARALATQAQSAATSDPLLALALAAESVTRSSPPPAEGRDALVAGRVALAESETVPVPSGAPLPVGDVLTATMTPDGATLVTGARDGEVALWDVATRERRQRFTGHTGGVQEAATDPDGRVVATAGADGAVWLWGLTAPNDPPAKPLIQLDSIVWSVAFSPDGSTLATASQDGTVRLFDTATGEQQGAPVGTRTGDFLSVAFSPDGSLLVAGTGSGELHSWILPSRQPLHAPFLAHTSDVWELVFDPSGERLLTGSSDGTARLWEIETVRLLDEPFRGEGGSFEVGALSGIVLSPDATKLYAGGDDGRLWTWTMTSDASLGTTTVGHAARIIDAAGSGDGRVLATLGADATVRLWEISSRPPAVATLDDLGTSAFGIAAYPDPQRLAVGDGDGTVHLLDAASGASQGELTGHDGQVFGVSYLPTGEALVTGDEAGALRRWDLATGEIRVERRTAHEGPITSVAASPNGSTLATASEDGTVRIWDAGDLSPRSDALGPHPGGATEVVFTPDGDRVITAAVDGRIRVWATDGHPDASFRAAADTVWGVAVSPDGAMLVTASGDGVVALWDLDDPSSPQRELTPHPDGATDAAFAEDGETVVTTSRDGSVRLWDRRSGQLLGEPFAPHTDAVWRVAVDPVRSVVWTAGVDGLVQSIDVLDLDRACEIAASSFDHRQRERFLGEEELLACAEDGHKEE